MSISYLFTKMSQAVGSVTPDDQIPMVSELVKVARGARVASRTAKAVVKATKKRGSGGGRGGARSARRWRPRQGSQNTPATGNQGANTHTSATTSAPQVGAQPVVNSQVQNAQAPAGAPPSHTAAGTSPTSPAAPVAQPAPSTPPATSSQSTPGTQQQASAPQTPSPSPTATTPSTNTTPDAPSPTPEVPVSPHPTPTPTPGGWGKFTGFVQKHKTPLMVGGVGTAGVGAAASMGGGHGSMGPQMPKQPQMHYGQKVGSLSPVSIALLSKYSYDVEFLEELEGLDGKDPSAKYLQGMKDSWVQDQLRKKKK